MEFFGKKVLQNFCFHYLGPVHPSQEKGTDQVQAFSFKLSLIFSKRKSIFHKSLNIVSFAKLTFYR